MTKLMKSVLGAVLGVVLIWAVSSRSVWELVGYVRASADQTVASIEDTVPAAVRDQKLKNEIDNARGEIIDRRVKLNLAASEIRQLQEDVDRLTAAVQRRETILAEAYPALETAATDRVTQVAFAGTDWLPNELGAEIDKLLMEQDRDERQLTIRREALARLEKSVEDGSSALTQMQSQLVEAENEFETLVVRRDQAHNENELLDLVAAAGRSSDSTAAQIGTDLESLRSDVQNLEARNEARRDLTPSADGNASRLTQAWSRLERLKKLHDEKSAQAGIESVQPGTSGAAHAKRGSGQKSADERSSSDDSGDKNVIIVIKDAAVETPAENCP